MSDVLVTPSISVTYDGVDLSQWITFSDIQRNVGQARNANMFKAGISDGKQFSYVSADENTITVKGDVNYDLQNKRRLIAGALTKPEPKHLIFSDEPDKYYYAIIAEQPSFPEDQFHGEISFTFIIPDGVAHSVTTQTADNMPYKDVPVNLLTGTSNQLASTSLSGWNEHVFGNVVPQAGTNYCFRVWIDNPTFDACAKLDCSDSSGSQIVWAQGNTISAGTSGYSIVKATTDSKYASIKCQTVYTFNHGTSASGSYGYKEAKLEAGTVPTPWSPNPADSEYYSDTITVHNGGTYPVEPVITATMHGDNGMVGFVNDQAGVLQFGTEEIDGYQTDESEKGLNGDFSKEIAGTIYNQAATNNPNWGGSSATPNRQTGSVKYVNDGYNGWHVEPVYAATGDFWNGPAMKVPIAPTKLNTRNNNFTFAAMLRFETSVSQLGRMELTLEAQGKVQYQIVVTDNNAVKDELQFQCYVKDQMVGSRSLNRSQFTNDKFIQARINKFGSDITFEISPWNGKSGRELTVALSPLTRPDMVNENVEAFSVWFERNKSWGESNIKLSAVQFDWQHVNWWTDIKNRFGKDDVLTIDVANTKVYLNGIEDRTLHTLGNMWQKFLLPPGDNTIKLIPSSWAQMFDCKAEIREAWL
ncbi:phage tail family protein [Lacticaseibacillus paracasei subsp. tolerans]|uniref:distal tail protein Dit n=1 Tax=Lacticaseibacillus paracasei TaxID=1597 RepID=UPI0018AD4698|nr:distal tail protein Dit [Lacticaseibacillus paracasei]QPI89337.1 phage tail family protein [Lacticaseibacillus paracasei subsp. tolerans]